MNEIECARWVKLAGLFIAVSLTVELVLISAMAILGTTSHFNVSSPTAIVIWSLMATFISIVLFSTIFISLMIMFQKQQEFNLKLALALGSINTAVGMGLAYLMTWPTANQLANYQGIAGAHAVGVSDGGPGLPFLGWSTVAGDLKGRALLWTSLDPGGSDSASHILAVANCLPDSTDRRWKHYLAWFCWTCDLAVA